MVSIGTRIKDLEEFQANFLAGLYPQRPAIGPNSLSKTAIRAKSITGSMISVSNLSAVNSNTGALTVDDEISIGSGGYIAAGKTGYSDTAAGFFLGDDSGTQKFVVGNASKSLDWDGTDLVITGEINATTGSIGGWVIGTLDLTSSTGTVGLASAGTWRIWVGNATPSSAPFRVNSSGAMYATSGEIGGWTINGITGLYLGSGSSTRGLDVGSVAFFAGGSNPSSAPFRVSTSGALTASNATITGGSVSGSVVGSGIPAGNITTGTLSADRIGASSIDATKINVSNLSSLSANVGTLTSGTINASSMTISNLSASSITAGTLVADRISGGNLGGGFGLGSADITLSSTGKIKWKSSASYIDNNELVLDTTSSSDPAISFERSSSTTSFIYSDATYSTWQSASGAHVSFGTSAAAFILTNNLSNTIQVSGNTLSNKLLLQNANTGSGSDVLVRLGGTADSEAFRVQDSSGNTEFAIGSGGAILTSVAATNTNTPSGATAYQLPIRNASGSIIGYIPIYGSAW